MRDFKFRDTLIGRTDDGDRILVDAELRSDDREYQTTDHRTVKGQRFSMSGLGIGYRCREAHSAGQMLDDLLRITKPVKGITLEDIKFLHDTWKANHLNDMNALCDHQTPIYDDSRGYRSLNLEAIGACPVSGYRPGSAWLYKAVDDAAMERVYAILSKLQ
jgi:hypothetical protein